MKVILLHDTPVSLVVTAARTCYQSFDKSNPDSDKNLLINLLKKDHTSVFEHKIFTFKIEDISRALLQELTRHRMASFSVKSTRYTLKKLKHEYPFSENDMDRVKKYIKLTGVPLIDLQNIDNLEKLRQLCLTEYPNDIIKYCLPESYLTELVLTINFRSLLNFFYLRLQKTAHFEIRDLASEMYKIVKTTDVGFLLDVFEEIYASN